MTEFIAKKREIFLVQMSLDTKRAEITKLEERALQVCGCPVTWRVALCLRGHHAVICAQSTKLEHCAQQACRCPEPRTWFAVTTCTVYAWF